VGRSHLEKGEKKDYGPHYRNIYIANGEVNCVVTSPEVRELQKSVTECWYIPWHPRMIGLNAGAALLPGTYRETRGRKKEDGQGFGQVA